MTCDADKVSGAIDALVQRLNQEAAAGRQLSSKEQLVLRLNEQYPNDVGVLSAFFLNQVHHSSTTNIASGSVMMVLPLSFAAVTCAAAAISNGLQQLSQSCCLCAQQGACQKGTLSLGSAIPKFR